MAKRVGFITLFLYCCSSAVWASTPNSIETALEYFNKGALDSCIVYTERAAEATGSQSDWEDIVLSIGREIRSANPAAGVTYFTHFFALAESTFGQGNETAGKLQGFVGECLLNQGKLFEAAKGFESSISILEKHASAQRFYRLILQKTGNVYTRLGDNKKALAYLNRCSQLAEEAGDMNRLGRVSCDINLVYINQGEYVKVQERSNELLDGFDFSERDLTLLKLFLADALTELGEFDEAETLLDELDQGGTSAYLQRIWGKWHFFQAEYSQSIERFKASTAASHGGRELANSYRTIGQAYLQLDSNEAAINYIQKAIAIYVGDSSLARSWENPLTNDLIAEPQLVLAFKSKATAFANLGETAKANACNDLAFEVAKLTGKAYLSEGSKLDLGRLVYPVCENSVLLNWSKAESGDLDAQARTFLAFEESKGSALKAYRQQAMALADIPAEITDRRQALSQEIVSLTNEIERAKSEAIKDSIAAKVFALERAVDTLHDYLTSTYPTYKQVYETDQLISLPILQSELSPRTCFISYFQAQDAYYAMAISKETVAVKEISVRAVEESNWEGILTYSPGAAFNTSAYIQLQKLLLGDLLGEFPETDHIVISPAGELFKVPFAALYFEHGEPLIRRYSIAYAVSATTFMTTENTKVTRTKVAALAPFGSEAPEGLSPLPASQKEVAAIARSFSTHAFEAEAANRHNLRDGAGSYKLLHLATHAEANLDDPLQSGLWLYDEKGQASKFTIPEIYNLEAKAELVVLSACNTGVGKVRSGEGVLSLSRAFSKAGAQSTLLTLWAVDDESTSRLMEYFYAGLKEGLPKEVALQQAQLTFLEEADPIYQHPWFWSGFVLSGNTDPISRGRGNHFLLLLLLPVLGATLLWFKRSQKRRS